MSDYLEQIQNVINEEINPVLALHKGSCKAVKLEDNVLHIKLQGHCAGCPSSKLTLMNGVYPILMEKVPGLVDIVLEQ